MEAVKTVKGKALPLGYSDVDTDQIVASDALKRIERTGFGHFLFAEWKEDPDFVMNKPEHDGAVVLIAGDNFGCGSSREHAVWAISDYGFGAVVAPSFADIFKNNCTKNGVLTVELPEDTIKALLKEVRRDPEAEVAVDLEGRTVSGPGVDEQFIVDDFTRHRLLNGLDDVGLTLAHGEDIEKFEGSRPSYLPKVL
ncbi:MAG: 3-isopropylmalate dehydratase small subunit [Actinomycetota bacterium]|nr:3-isopropylmalate dehydratase small subunit [Rubrobacter sp.]MDQ3508744.1 3-isopropylmalate dehydratase small subunit [Actinomycetota bacterium]